MIRTATVDRPPFRQPTFRKLHRNKSNLV